MNKNEKMEEVKNKILESLLEFLMKHSIDAAKTLQNEIERRKAYTAELDELKRIRGKFIKRGFIAINNPVFNHESYNMSFIKKDFIRWLNENKELKIDNITILDNHIRYIEKVLVLLNELEKEILLKHNEKDFNLIVNEFVKKYITIEEFMKESA